MSQSRQPRFALTESAQSDVNRMRNLYRSLMAEGASDLYAHERVVHLNSRINYDLVCLATERAYVDFDALRRAGLTD